MAQDFELAKSPRGRWAVYCKGSQTYEYEGKGKRFCQRMVEELNRTDATKKANEIKSVNLDKIDNAAARECVSAILSMRVFDDNLLKYTWTSGCTTIVHPIMFWVNEVNIQLEGNEVMRTIYDRAVNEVVNDNPTLFEYGYVDTYDGSCPMAVTFKYTEELKKRLKESEC